jgi:hypothetical protein
MKSTPNLPASSRMQMPSGGGSVKTTSKNGAASADVKSAGVSGGMLNGKSKVKKMMKKK